MAEAHDGKIDVLITDVVMPGMNGRQLADALLARFPHIKPLFISGYAADVTAHRGVLQDDVGFLQKPFSMAQLARHVRRAIER